MTILNLPLVNILQSNKNKNTRVRFYQFIDPSKSILNTKMSKALSGSLSNVTQVAFGTNIIPHNGRILYNQKSIIELSIGLLSRSIHMSWASMKWKFPRKAYNREVPFVLDFAATGVDTDLPPGLDQTRWLNAATSEVNYEATTHFSNLERFDPLVSENVNRQVPPVSC